MVNDLVAIMDINGNFSDLIGIGIASGSLNVNYSIQRIGEITLTTALTAIRFELLS
jgi:hypothetical protein